MSLTFNHYEPGIDLHRAVSAGLRNGSRMRARLVLFSLKRMTAAFRRSLRKGAATKPHPDTRSMRQAMRRDIAIIDAYYPKTTYKPHELPFVR